MARVVTLTVVALFALVLLAAGCGGGSDSENGGGNGEAVAENERFTEEQWAEYTAAAATYNSTLEESRTVFIACQEGALGNDELSQCIGAEVDNAVGATLEFEETLTSFEGSVAGACSDALVQYAGSVKIHASTLNALDNILQGDSVAEVSTATTNAVLGRDEVVEATPPFTAACEPV